MSLRDLDRLSVLTPRRGSVFGDQVDYNREVVRRVAGWRWGVAVVRPFGPGGGAEHKLRPGHDLLQKARVHHQVVNGAA